MADDSVSSTPDPTDPEKTDPEKTPDVFDGLVLDENFVRGGTFEPPHRTRDAIGRYQGDQSSARYGAPLQPVESIASGRKKTKRVRANRGASRPVRRDLASWLPMTVAIIAVVLLFATRY